MEKKNERPKKRTKKKEEKKCSNNNRQGKEESLDADYKLDDAGCRKKIGRNVARLI